MIVFWGVSARGRSQGDQEPHPHKAGRRASSSHDDLWKGEDGLESPVADLIGFAAFFGGSAILE